MVFYRRAAFLVLSIFLGAFSCYVPGAGAKSLMGWDKFHFGMDKYDLAGMTDVTYSENSDGTINVIGYHAGNYRPSIFLVFSINDHLTRDSDGVLTQIELDYDVENASCHDVESVYVANFKKETSEVKTLNHINYDNRLTDIIVGYDPGFQEVLLTQATPSVCSVSVVLMKTYSGTAARHAPYNLLVATPFIPPANKPSKEEHDAKTKEDADKRVQAEIGDRLIVLFSEYQIAERCAASNIIFTNKQVIAIKDEIVKQLNEAQVPKDTRDKAWEFTSSALGAQTLHEADCAGARTQLGYRLPQSVFATDTPNPF